MQKIEENSGIGKTSELFKKIRNTKGTFHAKMGTIKDVNGMDLTEADDIKKGGKNTQKSVSHSIGFLCPWNAPGKNTQKNNTKKILMIQITMMVQSLT